MNGVRVDRAHELVEVKHVDRAHELVEVKHTSRLKSYAPFVLVCQAIQVYYLSYASDKRERRQ
jgi:Domain of unknown function (DUF4216)